MINKAIYLPIIMLSTKTNAIATQQLTKIGRFYRKNWDVSNSAKKFDPLKRRFSFLCNAIFVTDILSSLVFSCFQQVSDMHSHLLSCLHIDLSEIKFYNCP